MMQYVSIDLKVNASVRQTRAYGWQLVQTLDILAFEDDGLRRLDLRQHISDVKSDRLLVSTASGARRLVVIANLPRDFHGLECVTVYEDAAALVSELSSDSPENPVMSGEAAFTAGRDDECTVVVEPIMSRIDVNSIKCTGDAAGLSDVSVYLTNVNGRCGILRREDFLPGEIICRDRCVETDLRMLAFPSMLCRNLKGSGTFGPVSLYCYPNDSERETAGSPFTRLVVEGTLDGSRRYYPIDINRESLSICPGIGRNKSYVFDITLSSRGFDSPEHGSDPMIDKAMGSVSIFPSSFIRASVGDNIYVWCETCPEDVEVRPDYEILDDDAARGMHEYSVDDDGKGVRLTLLKRGTSIVYFSAGHPVNDDVMALIVAD